MSKDENESQALELEYTETKIQKEIDIANELLRRKLEQQHYIKLRETGEYPDIPRLQPPNSDTPDQVYTGRFQTDDVAFMKQMATHATYDQVGFATKDNSPLAKWQLPKFIDGYSFIDVPGEGQCLYLTLDFFVHLLPNKTDHIVQMIEHGVQQYMVTFLVSHCDDPCSLEGCLHKTWKKHIDEMSQFNKCTRETSEEDEAPDTTTTKHFDEDTTKKESDEIRDRNTWDDYESFIENRKTTWAMGEEIDIIIILHLSQMPIIVYAKSSLNKHVKGNWQGSTNFKESSNPPAAIFLDPPHYMIITKGYATWELINKAIEQSSVDNQETHEESSNGNKNSKSLVTPNSNDIDSVDENVNDKNVALSSGVFDKSIKEFPMRTLERSEEKKLPENKPIPQHEYSHDLQPLTWIMESLKKKGTSETPDDISDVVHYFPNHHLRMTETKKDLMKYVPKFASKEMFEIYKAIQKFTILIKLICEPAVYERIQSQIPIPEGLDTQNTTIAGILKDKLTNIMKDTVIQSANMFVNTKSCPLELCEIFNQQRKRILYCQNLSNQGGLRQKCTKFLEGTFDINEKDAIDECLLKDNVKMLAFGYVEQPVMKYDPLTIELKSIVVFHFLEKADNLDVDIAIDYIATEENYRHCRIAHRLMLLLQMISFVLHGSMDIMLAVNNEVPGKKDYNITEWYKQLGFSCFKDKWESKELPNNVKKIYCGSKGKKSNRDLTSVDPYVLIRCVVKDQPLLFSNIYWRHCGDNIGSEQVVERIQSIMNNVIRDIITSNGIGYIFTKPNTNTLKKCSKILFDQGRDHTTSITDKKGYFNGFASNISYDARFQFSVLTHAISDYRFAVIHQNRTENKRNKNIPLLVGAFVMEILQHLSIVPMLPFCSNPQTKRFMLHCEMCKQPMSTETFSLKDILRIAPYVAMLHFDLKESISKNGERASLFCNSDHLQEAKKMSENLDIEEKMVCCHQIWNFKFSQRVYDAIQFDASLANTARTDNQDHNGTQAFIIRLFGSHNELLSDMHALLKTRLMVAYQQYANSINGPIESSLIPTSVKKKKNKPNTPKLKRKTTLRIKKKDTSATIIQRLLTQSHLGIFDMNKHVGVDVDDCDLDDGSTDIDTTVDNKKENEEEDSVKKDLSTMKKGADDIIEKNQKACTTIKAKCPNKQTLRTKLLKRKSSEPDITRNEHKVAERYLEFDIAQEMGFSVKEAEEYSNHELRSCISKVCERKICIPNAKHGVHRPFQFTCNPTTDIKDATTKQSFQKKRKKTFQHEYGHCFEENIKINSMLIKVFKIKDPFHRLNNDDTFPLWLKDFVHKGMKPLWIGVTKEKIGKTDSKKFIMNDNYQQLFGDTFRKKVTNSKDFVVHNVPTDFKKQMQKSVQEITASYPSKIRLIQWYPQIIHQMSYKAVGKKECVADSYIANVNLDAMFDVGEKLNIDQLLKVSSIAKNKWVTIDISGNRDKDDIHQAPPNTKKVNV